jgi:hypothetical protein
MNLAIILQEQGQPDEAVALLREVIRIKPGFAEGHYNLGTFLGQQGRLDEAVAESREAIRLKPGFAPAQNNLGMALKLQGKRDEALAAYRRAAELAAPGSPDLERASRLVRQLEQQISLAGRVQAVLDGRDRPASPAEGLIFGELCHNTKHFAAAARLRDDAMAADPRLAEDKAFENRFSASCSAAMAGAGKGEKEPPLDERARARWRKQAVAWLRSDLTRRAQQDRTEVAQDLRWWKIDLDLASIRDAAAINALPADEQTACRALWSEVNALLARARSSQAMASGVRLPASISNTD